MRLSSTNPVEQSGQTPSSQLPCAFLVDSSYYIYRAYFAAGGSGGNIVYGFARMLLALKEQWQPQYLAVAFDCPRNESFRRGIYPGYKANRDAPPEDLLSQIPVLKDVLRALNIPCLEAPRFEGDDILATAALRFANEGIKTVVMSGDKDLAQIVSDRVSLLANVKGEICDIDGVIEKFGVSPVRVPDLLGLCGDRSDNIPGVPNIGEKTAAELIGKFGSLEQILKWPSLVNGAKRKENLKRYADQALLSKRLATVRDDVPLEFSIEDARVNPPDQETLCELLAAQGLSWLAEAFCPPSPGEVELYSDGSISPAGVGGYGVVLRCGQREKELSGHVCDTTSQRMELMAAIVGLEALNGRQRVRVVSDSQYLVKGMNEWVPAWIRQGRFDNPDGVANQDLWTRLISVALKHDVSWQWVKGHAGHPLNERCDALAKQAVASYKVPITKEPHVVPRPDMVSLREDADGQLSLC